MFNKIITSVAAGTVVIKNLFGNDGSIKNKKTKIKMKQIKNNIKQDFYLNFSSSPPKEGTKHSFSLPLILSNLDINIDETNSSMINIFTGIFILTLISILYFINVIGYLTIFFN